MSSIALCRAGFARVFTVPPALSAGWIPSTYRCLVKQKLPCKKQKLPTVLRYAFTIGQSMNVSNIFFIIIVSLSGHRLKHYNFIYLGQSYTTQQATGLKPTKKEFYSKKNFPNPRVKIQQHPNTHSYSKITETISDHSSNIYKQRNTTCFCIFFFPLFVHRLIFSSFETSYVTGISFV